MESLTVANRDDGPGPPGPSESWGLSASQRRAELRRRKLLMNSEQRINRIMGFHRSGNATEEEANTEAKQRDSDKLNSLPVPSVSKRVVLGDTTSTGTVEHQGGITEIKETQLIDKKDSLIIHLRVVVIAALNSVIEKEGILQQKLSREAPSMA